jgi:hypothetical protein
VAPKYGVFCVFKQISSLKALTTYAVTAKDLVMFDVSYVVETIPHFTREVQSTKSYKKKSIPITLNAKLHSSCTNQMHPTNSSRNYICPNNHVKFICAHKYRARATHISKSSANQ